VRIDAPTTATVFDAARERRLFISLVLAALCGLRRGEITALRWRSVDLETGQLAVIASTEQLDKKGANSVREKEAKSGRARTVALPSLAVEELRRDLVNRLTVFLQRRAAEPPAAPAIPPAVRPPR